RAAPTPTKTSIKFDPLILKKGQFASPATARASNVLPLPGSPMSKTPRGILAPRRWYFFGFLRKSTTSANSSFASSAPATELKFSLMLEGKNMRAPLFPMVKILPPPLLPALRARIKYQTAHAATNKQEKRNRYQMPS